MGYAPFSWIKWTRLCQLHNLKNFVRFAIRNTFSGREFQSKCFNNVWRVILYNLRHFYGAEFCTIRQKNLRTPIWHEKKRAFTWKRNIKLIPEIKRSPTFLLSNKGTLLISNYPSRLLTFAFSKITCCHHKVIESIPLWFLFKYWWDYIWQLNACNILQQFSCSYVASSALLERVAGGVLFITTAMCADVRVCLLNPVLKVIKTTVFGKYEYVKHTITAL